MTIQPFISRPVIFTSERTARIRITDIHSPDIGRPITYHFEFSGQLELWTLSKGWDMFMELTPYTTNRAKGMHITPTRHASINLQEMGERLMAFLIDELAADVLGWIQEPRVSANYRASMREIESWGSATD